MAGSAPLKKPTITKPKITVVGQKKSDNEIYIPYVWRRDDHVRFSRNPDGTYSMDESEMSIPYKYSLYTLLERCDNAFTIFDPKGNPTRK